MGGGLISDRFTSRRRATKCRPRIGRMVADYPAPELCQGSDEDLLLQMGAVIYPGFVARSPTINGLRLRVDGDYRDRSLDEVAASQFQILLGALRAWRPVAGQRNDEGRPPGIGSGSVRDEHGNQVVAVGSVISYAMFGGEFEGFAGDVSVAMDRSVYLRNALWLSGRRDRNAADFFMIYEYAEQDFGGRKAMTAELGISDNDISRLNSSANNLAPTRGGRHANGTGVAEWSVDQQRDFIALFLRRWIAHRARQ